MRKAAGTLLVLVLLTACGAASNGRADTVENQPPQTSGHKATSSSVFVLTAPQIRQRLLRVSDMPTGYTVDTSKDDSSSTPSGCRKLDALDGYDKRTSATGEAKFTGGTFGPFVMEAVSVPRASASSVYGQFVDAMRACPSFRSKNDDGSYSTATISALSFPKLADDTFAAQMKIAPVPMVGSAYVDLVVVRIGNVFMLFTDAQVAAAPDASIVEELTRKAVNRLQRD